MNTTSRGVTSTARRLTFLTGSGGRLAASPKRVYLYPTASARFAPSALTTPAANYRSSSTKPKPSGGSGITAGGSNAPAVADQDHLALAKPLDFDMASKVEGQESQMVTFELDPGQVIRVSESSERDLNDGTHRPENTCCAVLSCFGHGHALLTWT